MRSLARVLADALLLAGAPLLAGALLLVAAPAAWADDAMVHVGHGKLDPAEVTVSAGDTVVFHNVDAMPGGHTVVADDGAFRSPALEKDQQWSHTFTEAGRHPYRISEHPDAQGVIVVVE